MSERPLDAAIEMAVERALSYVATVDHRNAAPTAEAVAALESFDEPLLDGARPATETIDLLASVGGPATMASTGPRYYGFVNGATLPVAVGAGFVAQAWDQNAALPVMSPVAAKLHDVAAAWLTDLLGLESGTDVAFVTGATVANATCLAAARDALLDSVGWDVQSRGLFAAPEIHVVIGARAHSTLGKSLGMVGLGRDRVTVVPADDQGRMIAGDLAGLDVPAGPVLVCAQAGEVNTGAFDPFAAIAEWCRQRAHAWMHVDGAFGLWALADPSRGHLVEGLRRADSLATDAHKWLNVGYDCGIAFVKEGALRRTFAAVAGYLPPDDGFEAMHHTPQSSQRARQIEVWAVLRTLGRGGVAELVQRACDSAVVIADELAGAGFDILNDVVLNQVLVRYRDGETTARLIEAIQEDGRIWCGPTTWMGETVMRISVSSWKTTADDAVAAAAVIRECAGRL